MEGSKEAKCSLKRIRDLIVLLYTSASAHKSAGNNLAAYVDVQTQIKMIRSENGRGRAVNASAICAKSWRMTVTIMTCLLYLIRAFNTYK